MFWDNDLSVWQNIIVNFSLRRQFRQIAKGKWKGREWKEVFKELKEKAEK